MGDAEGKDGGWMERQAARLTTIANRLADETRIINQGKEAQIEFPEPITDLQDLLEGMSHITHTTAAIGRTFLDTARGGWSEERKERARQQLKDEHALVDEKVLIETHIGDITFGLGQLYQGKLKGLAAAFAQKWPPEKNIFIFDPSRIDVANEILERTPGERREGGSYSPHQDIIKIPDPQDKLFRYSQLKIVLAEEWIHALLVHTRQSPIPLVRESGNLIRMMKIMREERSWKHNQDARQHLEGYLSNPEEQIVKALAVAAMEAAGIDFIYDPASPKFRELYYKSAAMGQDRIAELGIGAVLKGRYKTNHEQDFHIKIWA